MNLKIIAVQRERGVRHRDRHKTPKWRGHVCQNFQENPILTSDVGQQSTLKTDQIIHKIHKSSQMKIMRFRTWEGSNVQVVNHSLDIHDAPRSCAKAIPKPLRYGKGRDWLAFHYFYSAWSKLFFIVIYQVFWSKSEHASIVSHPQDFSCGCGLKSNLNTFLSLNEFGFFKIPHFFSVLLHTVWRARLLFLQFVLTTVERYHCNPSSRFLESGFFKLSHFFSVPLHTVTIARLLCLQFVLATDERRASAWSQKAFWVLRHSQTTNK